MSLYRTDLTRPRAGVVAPAIVAPERATAISVYVDAGADAGQLGSTVNVYGIVEGVRALLGTGTLAADSGENTVNVKAAAASWEVEYVPAADAAGNVAVSARVYGTEPADTSSGGSGINALQIQSVPVSATPPAAFQVLGSDDGATWKPIALTADWVGAGFAPTLTFHAGDPGTAEVGQTPITPTFDGNPAPSAAGVTHYVVTDPSAAAVDRLGSANGFQAASPAYTAPNAPGTMTWTANVTKDGVNKNATLSRSVFDRFYVGQDAAGDGTGAVNAGNNATLTGGAATAAIAGTLGSFGVGASFVIPASGVPKYTYLLVAHTAAVMTFKSGGAPFPMTRVTSGLAYVNQYGVSRSFDLYVSNALTLAFTVVRDT